LSIFKPKKQNLNQRSGSGAAQAVVYGSTQPFFRTGFRHDQLHVGLIQGAQGAENMARGLEQVAR
jgi:hypothetical protein